jgi:hypothetical protein
VTSSGPPAILDPQVRPVSCSLPGASASGVVARGLNPDAPLPLPPGPTGSDGSTLKMPTRIAPEPPPPDGPPVAGLPTAPDAVCPEACTEVECDGNCCVECDGCCCPVDCCDRGGHHLYVSAEYLMWWLKQASTPPLVTGSLATTGVPGAIGQQGTVVLFGGSHIDSDVRSGGRFRAGYWFDDDESCGVEGSFFFLGQRGIHFTAASGGVPGLFRPFFKVNSTVNADGSVSPPGESAEQVAFPGTITGRVSADLSSRLWGADANFRGNLLGGPLGCGCCYRVDGLAGFRYIGFDESLGVAENLTALTSPGGTFAISDRFATTNRFYGGQIGGVAELRHGPWTLDLRSTVALGWTRQTVDISGSTSINGGAPLAGGLLALPSNIGHFGRNRFGVVPELGMNLGYQVTDYMRVFVGYNFIYWNNVVRPGQQIDRAINTTQLPNSGVPVSGPVRPLFAFHSTDFWAQGVNFGLEFRY